ncbi:GNAT family N-acetyltransferase [Variovorax ginsengisoli]|uniref:Ribosomal protein S18 acetylase RimI-like enzyme n=1 Tax=Variovorax ginsengisoli TaxID=363844 RepID=A0ABT9SF94_9BURK|nr:GNAT family N-acetyltransferase [Variovorax ginsengisoli]MDP9902431.1 ribosomal protein S18 acetylase RimI-like enzyme [Variovorax ginsengisoli]
MTTHQLRAARPENIAEIVDLILMHGPNPWNWLPPDEVARHVGQIATGAVEAVVAWDGSALQGVVTFCQTQDFARYQPEGRAGETHGYICEAVVHRDAVGQGLGARLLAAALDVLKARGMREVYIDRHEENAASAGMMRKAGFTVIDTFPEPAKRPHGSGRTTVCRIFIVPNA